MSSGMVLCGVINLQTIYVCTYCISLSPAISLGLELNNNNTEPSKDSLHNSHCYYLFACIINSLYYKLAAIKFSFYKTRMLLHTT